MKLLHFSLCERVLVKRKGWRGWRIIGEVEKSGHQSFNGISDLSLGRTWNNWRRMSRRSVAFISLYFEYRFILFSVYCVERGSWKPLKRRNITRKKLRKRKSKGKRMIERGNIDETRYLFLFFLDSYFRGSVVCKRKIKDSVIMILFFMYKRVLHEYVTNYR